MRENSTFMDANKWLSETSGSGCSEHEPASNPSDFTETLTPPPNSAHGHGMNITVPVACSGMFIGWDQAGKLEEFISMCGESQQLLRHRQEIETKLRYSAQLDLKTAAKKCSAARICRSTPLKIRDPDVFERLELQV